jgi:hypothetical protein
MVGRVPGEAEHETRFTSVKSEFFCKVENEGKVVFLVGTDHHFFRLGVCAVSKSF